jgi:hypothetical protein
MAVSDYEFVRHGPEHIMLNEVLLQSGIPVAAPGQPEFEHGELTVGATYFVDKRHGSRLAVTR